MRFYGLGSMYGICVVGEWRQAEIENALGKGHGEQTIEAINGVRNTNVEVYTGKQRRQ